MVKAKWVVRVPLEAKRMVKKGERLKEGDVLIKSAVSGVINIDTELFFKNKSKEEREEIVKGLQEKSWEKGEVMMEVGSFMSKKKMYAPEKGKVLALDEFGNMIFGVLGEEKVIVAPVAGEFTKEEKGKMYIEFDAREYKGEALVMGKRWGKMRGKIVSRLADLDKDCDGAIIMVEKLDDYFWRKAEAIGVAGVIVKGESDNLETEIPVLALNDFEWLALSGEMENSDGVRALLNSKAGRLLLVLE